MDDAPRALEIPNPDAWMGSMILATILMATASAGAALACVAHPDLLPRWGWAALVVAPVGVLFYAYFHGPLRRRTVRLRRAGSTVLGAPGGPLPVNEGQVVVERLRRSGEFDSYHVYEVRYEGPTLARTLFKRAFHATEVRACAEGLCRVGRWDMVWRTEGSDEVRTPDALDRPLVARLAEAPAADHAGAVSGRAELRGRHLPLFFWPVGFVVFVLIGLLTEKWPHAITWAVLQWPLGFAGVSVLVLAAFDLCVGFPATVTAAGVETGVRVLGIPVARRFVPVERLESLYIEQGRFYFRLVFAGDGVHAAAGRFLDLAAARAAREASVRALLSGAREAA